MWAVASLWHLTTFSLTNPPTHTFNRLVWDWTLPAGKLPNSDKPSYAPCPYPANHNFLGFYTNQSLQTGVLMFTFIPLCGIHWTLAWHTHTDVESSDISSCVCIIGHLFYWIIVLLDTCMTQTLVLSPATSPRVFVLLDTCMTHTHWCWVQWHLLMCLCYAQT